MLVSPSIVHQSLSFQWRFGLYFLFKGAEKSSKALSKKLSGFIRHHLWVTSPRSQLCSSTGAAFLPSEILNLPSLNFTTVISFPPCCAEESGEPSHSPLLKLRRARPLEGVSPRSTPDSLMEGTLLPTWTGVKDGHQYSGIPELVCITLCFNWCY